MSEREKKSCYFFFLKILIESFKIFPRNKHIYLLIFIFLSLPLSILHFSLSLTSYPFKSKVLHLEFLATRAATRFESRQVWRESREFAVSLFHLKLIYFLPSYFLSLVAAITVVISTESAYNRKPTTLRTVFSAVKTTWLRPLLTSLFVYAILLLYSSVPHTLLAIIGNSNPRLRFVIWGVGACVELYIMAALGLSLVVSIVEVRFGWDAIGIGWRLMEGRRICGWSLCGLMVMVTAGIGWRMERLMVIRDNSAEEPKWMVAEGWERAVLVGLYGVAVVWGFIVTTVFYCECRKRHVVLREEEEAEEQQQDQQGIDS